MSTYNVSRGRGRVVWRNVEHPEVGGVALDLRSLVGDEPELAEDLAIRPIVSWIG